MKKEKQHGCDAIVSCECVRNLLNSIHGSYLNFKPTTRFYTACGINCRRWAKLVRGELSITVDELKQLCKTINVEFSAKTFARQLNMFDDGEDN
jgi:hypothetical protein